MYEKLDTMPRGKIKFTLRFIGGCACSSHKNCEGELGQVQSKLNKQKITACRKHQRELIWCERLLLGRISNMRIV